MLLPAARPIPICRSQNHWRLHAVPLLLRSGVTFDLHCVSVLHFAFVTTSQAWGVAVGDIESTVRSTMATESTVHISSNTLLIRFFHQYPFTQVVPLLFLRPTHQLNLQGTAAIEAAEKPSFRIPRQGTDEYLFTHQRTTQTSSLAKSHATPARRLPLLSCRQKIQRESLGPSRTSHDEVFSTAQQETNPSARGEKAREKAHRKLKPPRQTGSFAALRSSSLLGSSPYRQFLFD
ncbi:hypothetical protein HDV57DRAFT_143631 [Trichoderma longibrachiatum]|uniref:Uncharacterized protein n=1 Tax=Trichoderma longibrachiatum ATCC 18648 TaxID=983965 RepID=A0A2T4C6S8_TRILO|nr:hypothetical protein M440DRAFT_275936 [Trichoderma longibrachiatum ATCC 18648]